MNTHAPAASEAIEFAAWLKHNDRRLREYAPDEIASLALLCGFNLSTVCSNVCERVSHIKRLMNFWESPLSEYWLELVDRENGIEPE